MGLNSLARLGYLARATVYFLIGGFAILAGIGSPEGAQTDSKGVLRRLMEQPFGHFLLFLLAIGLFSYAIWRFSQSFFDAAKIGTSRKAIFKRIGYAFGGMTHTLLGIFAIKLIFAIQPESSDSKAKKVHWLLTQPFGQMLTGAVALSIIGFGISQLLIGWNNKFLEHLNLPGKFRKWLCPICKFGFIARGFIFVLVGSFFLRAAIYFNSHEAGGFEKAWRVLRQQPFGEPLIFVVAIGLITFAVFGIAEAKYQNQIPT